MSTNFHATSDSRPCFSNALTEFMVRNQRLMTKTNGQSHFRTVKQFEAASQDLVNVFATFQPDQAIAQEVFNLFCRFAPQGYAVSDIRVVIHDEAAVAAKMATGATIRQAVQSLEDQKGGV